MAVGHNSSSTFQLSRAYGRFSQTGFVVFIAGYYAFPNTWTHLLWFGFAVALPLMFSDPFPAARVFGRQRFLVWAAIFVFSMLLVSFRPGTPWPDAVVWRAFLALGDAVLLLLFLYLAFCLGNRPSVVGRRAMVIMIQVAGVTAALSFAVFYGFWGNSIFTSRLENVVVHFGLAPVLTGFLYGFAALTAAVLSLDEERGRPCAGLLALEAFLLLAAFLTHSRGTLLALFCGFAVLTVIQFRRKLLLPMAVFLVVTLVYQFVLPQLGRVSSPGVSERPATPATPADPSPVIVEEPANPAAALVARKDAGRLTLYRKILDRMQPPGDHLMGRGRWADDDALPELPWAYHPHSVYLGTFYRGGVLGVCLLGVVLLLGGFSCWRAARRGRPLWFTLASFGCVALAFDGDDLVTMASLPRVEPLLWWFPLAAGAGAAVAARDAKESDKI